MSTSILFVELSCTGQVGTGPSGSTSLLLAIPVETERFIDPCGVCSSTDHTGVFFGVG